MGLWDVISSGAKKLAAAAKKRAKKIAADIKKKAKEAANILQGLIDKAVKFALKPFNVLINMTKTIKSIKCFVDKFPVRVENVKSGISNISYGIVEHIEATGEAAVLGVDSVGDLGEVIGEFLSSYGYCFSKYIDNFGGCWPFYTFDVLMYLLYLLIYFSLWVLLIPVKVIFDMDDPAGDLIDLIFEFVDENPHPIHYPKSVRNDCYLCKVLKTDVIVEQSSNIDNVFTNEIPALFDKGNDLMLRGSNQINESTRYYPRKPSSVPIR
jgi:hypothetical protein